MNIIEKSVWLHKVPKNKRSDLKILLSRNNFHEIKEIGNEDYVINIVNQDYVIDAQDCEGELYILSASSRYEIKSLKYKLRFGEKNEIILQKPENLYLTESEDISLDRYMAAFCSTIKRELDYQVAYSVAIVESQIQYNPQGMISGVQQTQSNQEYGYNQMNVVGQNNSNQQIQMNSEQVQTQMKSNSSQQVKVSSNDVPQENLSQENNTQFNLNDIYACINASDNAKISLTAYCQEGVYGVNIDVNNELAGEITVVENSELDDIDKLRALTTCIFMAQGLGSYLRLRNSSYDIKFFYYEDEESSVQPPENFVDLSVEVSQMMN